MKRWLPLLLLPACSPVQQGNAVLAVFRPDALAANRCYEREMFYNRASGTCFTPRHAVAQQSAPPPLAPDQQAYLDWLTRHAGPQRYSGQYLEMATGASPQFTHTRGRW